MRHWFGRHAIDLAALYERGYVDATYGGPAGMRARLNRCCAAARALRQCRPGGAPHHLRRRSARPGTTPRRLLDVGAGIGLSRRHEGRRLDRDRWEPDPRTAAHPRDAVGIGACRPIEELASMQIELVDAITFNKVLEHVEDP